MDQVWVVSDYDDLVAVAATEASAHQAARMHVADHIDKGYFGPDTEKRFKWSDNDPHKTGSDCRYLSVWGRASAHGSPMDWRGTGVTVSPQPLLP